MSQNRRQSIRPSDIDQLRQLPNPESIGDRRRSIYTVGTGRRSSSIHSGQLSLLAVRKFNKKFGRAETAFKSVNYEATYRMEPNVTFSPPSVKRIIVETLKDLLEDQEYDPMSCSSMCRSVGEEVKDRVKLLGYDRYKIVVMVVIGEKKDQGVMVTSRCAWYTKFDNFAEGAYQNKHLFCSTQVFGLYLD
ncbi:dynein light chain Tctex-type protein 2B-like [Gigantopelta aegis]|uniref:dynein light chain Tctex-type protein 2B-like n=1 Tax=Gigantopelta aegis TaxID=1735272 RepID=UPI001B88B59D|nr:dynein light chain Tctex-type protein 2B-like [Gigantopelta aegis]